MTDRTRKSWPSFKKNFQIDWKANKGIMCLNVSLVLGLSEATKVQRLWLQPKPHCKLRECLVHYKNGTIDWRNMQKYGKDFYGLSGMINFFYQELITKLNMQYYCMLTGWTGQEQQDKSLIFSSPLKDGNSMITWCSWWWWWWR